jgi:tRNA pseudouridine-54 N-methylase
MVEALFLLHQSRFNLDLEFMIKSQSSDVQIVKARGWRTHRPLYDKRQRKMGLAYPEIMSTRIRANKR